MANVFTAMPIYLDTDTTVVGNTNWRGTSGGQLLSPNIKGIKPIKVVIGQADSGVALATGNIVINDPQQTTGNLFKYVVIAAGQAPIEIHFESAALWRDFIVTGLTATKASLQIFYKD